jgi:hypothetical protein
MELVPGVQDLPAGRADHSEGQGYGDRDSPAFVKFHFLGKYLKANISKVSKSEWQEGLFYILLTFL